MNQTKVIISNNYVDVQALFYISNNNYYTIYTDGEIDENGFVVLHIAKILQEVVATENGSQPTGYLIGTTISNDEEYTKVKQDISNIIDAKQNNIDANVQFVEASVLGQIKIRDTKIFRLKKDVFEQIFGAIIIKNDVNDTPTDNITTVETQQTLENPNNNNVSFEQKYYKELEKNKDLQNKLDSLIQQINDLKNTLV